MLWRDLHNRERENYVICLFLKTRMKLKMPSAEVAEFEAMWESLHLIDFCRLTREIDFVNETTTIIIPDEYVKYLPK